MPRQIPQELVQKIALELEAGRKIEAIKLLREATGMSLVEAKETIDAVAGASGPPKDPARKSGCLGAVMVLLALTGVAGAAGVMAWG